MALKATFQSGRIYFGRENAGYYAEFYEPNDLSIRKATYLDETFKNESNYRLRIPSDGFVHTRLKGNYSVVVSTKNGDVLYTEHDINIQPIVSDAGYNVIKNPSFELKDADNFPLFWDLVQYDNETINEVADRDSSHGKSGMLFASKGNGGGYVTTADYIPVSELEEISIFFDIKSSVVDVRNLVEILWYERELGYVGLTSLYDENAANPLIWTRKQYAVTPIATACFAKLRIYGCHSSVTAAGFVIYDGVHLSKKIIHQGRGSAVMKTGPFNDFSSAPLKNIAIIPGLTDYTETVALSPAITFNPKLAVAFAPSGEIMVLGSTSSPWLKNYKFENDSFIELALWTYSVAPSIGAISLDFSSDGLFLAVGSPSAPRLIIYRVASGRYTQILPAVAPAGNSTDVAWSNNGEFLAVASGSSPYINIYQQQASGLVKLANPAILPASSGNVCCWSPNDSILFVGHTFGDKYIIYERSGVTFTKIGPLPGFTPLGAFDDIGACEFSYDGAYLLIATDNYGVHIFSKTGSTFTFVQALTTNVGDTARAVFYPNSYDVILNTENVSPTADSIDLYTEEAGVWTLAKVLLGHTAEHLAISPDGQFLAYSSGLFAPPVVLRMTELEGAETNELYVKNTKRAGS